MPIRRAGLTPIATPNSQRNGRIAALVIVVAMLGIAFALGEHEASTQAPDWKLPPQPVVLDPAILDSLAKLETFDGPLSSVPLAHELHLSQISEGELFATGVVYGHVIFDIEAISVEVRCRDLAGNVLASPRALVACNRLRPGERCAWMLETKVPGSIAEVSFDASGRRALDVDLAPFDLRSARHDALELNPNRRLLKFETPNVAITKAWATVTAYNSQDRTLGVTETRWPDALEPGAHALEVGLPRPPSEVARYEVHVGGERSQLPAGPAL